MDIEQIVGDCIAFFSDLFYQTRQLGIDMARMPISHFTYRTATIPEYERMRDQLKKSCKEFVETQFNGRAISILILKNPLPLGENNAVSVIELAAPRPAHIYPSGFESVGWIVGEKLAEFNERYKNKLTGIKDHGKHCQPSFVTFKNDKTAKFYDISLVEIVRLLGWKFEDF